MDAKKKMLVLGGTYATYDLVKLAKKLGYYVVVTDYYKDGVAKQIADETAMISTTDIPSLKTYIADNDIEGIFCGPSEVNVRNLLKVCEETGLSCYATSELWDKTANKDVFKQYCIANNVDCPREYSVSEYSSDEEFLLVDYPVIVKPVDGCSSVGISVCRNTEELKDACVLARESSRSKKIIVEKYIEQVKEGKQLGEIFGARYIIKDGEPYPYFVMDTYIVDPEKRDGLISGFTISPSKYLDYYMKNMDTNVRNMIKDMGLKNGVCFFQGLPCDGKIYIHEMGYRLSGGMLYKLTSPLVGVNDMEYMIQYAMSADEQWKSSYENINLTCNGKIGAQLMVPLKAGKIKIIEGLDEAKALDGVIDFIQYYHEGDEVEERVIGTLSQHFGRFSIISDDYDKVCDTVHMIQEILKVKDENNNQINCYPFNTDRLDF